MTPILASVVYTSRDCLEGHHSQCEDPMDCTCPCHEDDE